MPLEPMQRVAPMPLRIVRLLVRRRQLPSPPLTWQRCSKRYASKWNWQTPTGETGPRGSHSLRSCGWQPGVIERGTDHEAPGSLWRRSEAQGFLRRSPSAAGSEAVIARTYRAACLSSNALSSPSQVSAARMALARSPLCMRHSGSMPPVPKDCHTRSRRQVGKAQAATPEAHQCLRSSGDR